MRWSQNSLIPGFLEVLDKFYIKLLPDCRDAKLIAPTLAEIQISSTQSNTYVAAFDDDIA